MNRPSFLCSAMLGAALVSSSALAQQQQTLRQQLAGTWEVVSLGNPESPAAKMLSTTPKGYLVLAGSGKAVLVLRNPNRAKDAGPAGYDCCLWNLVGGRGEQNVNSPHRGCYELKY